MALLSGKMKFKHFDLYSCCFLVVFAVLLGNVEAQTSSQSEAGIDYQIDTESVSDALIVQIHGSGTLDLSKLEIELVGGDNYDDDGDVEQVYSVQTAILTLDKATHKDFESTTDYKNDLLSAGLGAVGNDGNFYMCCSESAIQAGACDLEQDEEPGELIMEVSKEGSSSVKVETLTSGGSYDSSANGSSSTGSSRGWGMHQEGVVRFSKTSHLAVVFINCEQLPDNHNTLFLRIRGKVTWTSSVTPGMVSFYMVMTSFQVGLFLWYRWLMLQNQESRINIETWIVLTLALAAANAIDETLKFAFEAYGSNEIMFFKISSMLLSLTRHSVTRCLYLVLSLGLGVVTASLSKITTFLIAVFLATDVFLLWSMHMAFYMNIHINIPYSGQLVYGMERIFTFWIPGALLYTMYHLKKNEEHLKLIRYKTFLGIYFLTATLSFLESHLLYQFNGQRFNRSTMREANDIIYLVPLACVAVLWKPNPQQQMYSYVLLQDGMEEENTNQALGRDIELTDQVDDGTIDKAPNQVV